MDKEQAATIETKSVVSYAKAVEGRTVTGYCAVMGNIDSYGDKIWPGAFSKTISERAKRMRYLWMHDTSRPPVAVIRSMREVGRESLPPEMLEQCPDALGALEVTREYLNTESANEILEGIKAGAISEMSIGYDTVQGKVDYESLPNGNTIRNLREIRLWEASDVTWGANDATMNVSLKSLFTKLSDDALIAQMDWAMRELKEGRVLNKGNLSKLKAALATLQEILFAAEPPAVEDEEDDSEDAAMKALTEQIATRVQIAQREAEMFLFDLK